MSFQQNCRQRASIYANQQGALYDKKNNNILYGLSNHLKASGVSDGTCNQIDPRAIKNNCGSGAGGGNPCFPNTIEPFENNGSCNINSFVTLLFLLLIVLLFFASNHTQT